MSWELRRSLRYGSEHLCHVKTRARAEEMARDDIKKNGNVGRIHHVDEAERIVYYDVHEELT